MRLQRNAQAIYQDLVDQFGFTASYDSVKRFVRALRHVDPEQFDRLAFNRLQRVFWLAIARRPAWIFE